MTAAEIQEALADPFPPDKVGWKAQTAKESRALAVGYIDARDVMDRLDAVVGVHNWKDEYIPQPDGNVICILSLRIEGEWVSKSDIGGPSEQRDPGDKEKAAFSDALKRTAVKFGIGRYLYSLEGGWVDYDPKYKKLLKTPQLPEWALPRAMRKGAKASPPKAAPVPPSPANGSSAPVDPKIPKNAKDFETFYDGLVGWLSEKHKATKDEVDAEMKRYAADQKYPTDYLQWDEKAFAAVYLWMRDWGKKRPVKAA